MDARALPDRMLPVATTVSLPVATSMAVPLAEKEALLLRAPTEPAGWAAYVAELEKDEPALIKAVLAAHPASIEVGRLGGVTVRTIRPASAAGENDARLLIHVHGGAYVTGGGDVGVREAILVAHHTSTTVVSIDYRMPPMHPFPAAVDDAVAVWAALLERHAPARMGVFGTSTGGALTVALGIAARDRGLPLPAALVAATPWSDLTETGDSYFTNRQIDGAVPFYAGLLERAARLYAGPDNLKHPLASPVYAFLKGLPPTMLTTGTRDLFLSCTVRLHRAMRAAGVAADLHVFEGISHGELTGLYTSPEALDAFDETVAFFDRHLGR